MVPIACVSIVALEGSGTPALGEARLLDVYKGLAEVAGMRKATGRLRWAGTP